SGAVDPPAEVEVVAEDGDAAVEAAQPVPYLALDQHASRADREDRADFVVLALVVLVALKAGPAAAVGRDRRADLEQLLLVVPAADLGAEHGGIRFVLGGQQQLAQGVG